MSNYQSKNHTKGIAIAVLFSVTTFIVVLAISLYTSLINLNILTSVNRSLAISGFILLSIFIITETFARYRSNAEGLAVAAKTMGVFGFIFASIHILSVTVLLAGIFSKEWLSEQGTSINFAWAAVVALTLLFLGFIKTISEKLGKKRWLYIQILGYFSLALIFAHIFLIKNLSFSSVQKSILDVTQKPELVFVLAFLGILIIAKAFLSLLNKRVSLQTKIITHTLLYLTISAVVIISYLAITETERNYSEVFRSNKYTIDYIKEISSSADTANEKEVYATADAISRTSQQEITVFFLNNERQIVHHPEKRKEDTPYTLFNAADIEDTASAENIKRSSNGSTFLDTISKLNSENYVVVSTDYSKARENSTRQLFYSSFLIIIITSVTTAMMVLFGRTNIIKPIKKITVAARNISGGNFDSKVEMHGNDEFKVLADTFNNMSQTLQKQINDLMKLDKLKNEFIAIASHNLRTPLTTLRGYLDSLEMGQSGKLNHKQKETLGKAQHATTSLVSLTEGLINITSLEREGVKIEKDSVNLNETIGTILKEIAPQAKAKDIKIKNNLGKDPIRTIGDAIKLKQAFMSVLENAIKFNNKGGQIIIEKIIDDTKQPTIGRKEFIITIKDTGIGISKEEKENVFKKFNRGTSTYTYEYEGVGLGLYLSRLIIQAHHGRIWFESTEGKGTTFYISLTLE